MREYRLQSVAARVAPEELDILTSLPLFSLSGTITGDGTMAACNVVPGQRFGRLTVLRKAAKTDERLRWVCQCDCGVVKDILSFHLTRKPPSTVSCGCYHAELFESIAGRSYPTHGMSGSYVYGCWLAMKDRCGRKSHPHYARYGGRGIAICKPWLSFENFYADMGDPPSTQHSIDRIDNDGPYEPGNCRWVTAKQQARNRCNNRLLTHNGKTLCLAGWSESTGILNTTIRERLRRRWTTKEALETPVERRL